MANAESIYVDPSALLKLYLKEPESRAMTAWRAKVGDRLPVTHHGRVELTNGIGLAAYRGIITGDAHDAALAALDDDFAQGRYKQMDVLWRATLKRAGDLSREHTPSIGCRSLDVLHVASAIELELKHFATFDVRQQQLARAAGLKLVTPAG
ncbi:MAG: type II toxin-antitoxin system VapC family toxin [Gammaproteobacteria bacterium]|nr:MAG: type II toxin-antitoxin system VapC family toxin [Gammaproteobacteria bacterium]